MLPLAVKDKEATFALVLMTADPQLRKRDIEDLYDNFYSPPPKKIVAA